MYIFTYLHNMMQLHPAVQILTMLLQDLFIFLLNGKIPHFTTVFFHIKKLLTITAFIVQHIFITRGTQSPTTCVPTFIESSFSHNVVLMLQCRVSLLCQRFEGNTIQPFRKLDTCPIADSCKEIYPRKCRKNPNRRTTEHSY